MIKNTINLARRFGSKVKSNVDRGTAKVFTAVSLTACVGSSFAAAGDGSIDTVEALAAIAGGLAAALVVSVAMTAAKIGVRASKLPRSGA